MVRYEECADYSSDDSSGCPSQDETDGDDTGGGEETVETHPNLEVSETNGGTKPKALKW